MYNEDEKFVIWLDSLDFGRKKMAEILRLHEHPSDIMEHPARYISRLSKILTDDEYTIFMTSLPAVNTVVNEMTDRHMYALTFMSPNYPERLLNISLPPMVLYYAGDITLLEDDSIIAIVGTRKPSKYGEYATDYFTSNLVKNNFVTISGLAYGVDTIVAESTLKNDGCTIAVMGCGLDKIYPARNTNLAKQIVVNGGLVISEYHAGVGPKQYNFPERNRIISGLSRGVLVVEGGENSGSLITANLAIEQGRSLFVVPANINSVTASGTNKLLKEYPSACTVNFERIVEDFGYSLVGENEQLSIDDIGDLTPEQKIIVDILSRGELNYDELASKSNMDANDLNVLLTEMELSGLIVREGNIYSV